MPSTPKRIYWDACAWIGYINKEPDKLDALTRIWKDSQNGLFEVWTSTYSFIEVIYGKNQLGEVYPSVENDAIVFALLEAPNVERAQVDVEIAKLARDLKRAHHAVLQKRADAIHLATAICYNCEELHTWDGSHLIPLNELVTRRDGTPLKILAPKEPQPERQMQLPLAPKRDAASPAAAPSVVKEDVAEDDSIASQTMTSSENVETPKPLDPRNGKDEPRPAGPT